MAHSESSAKETARMANSGIAPVIRPSANRSVYLSASRRFQDTCRLSGVVFQMRRAHMLRSSCSRMWVRSSSRLRRYRRQRHRSPVDRRPQKFPGLSGKRRRQAIALAASRADSLARHSSVRRSRRSKCRFGFRNVCFAGSEDKRSIVESPLLFFRRGSYCCPGLEGRCEEGLHPPGPGTSRLLLPRYPSRSSPYGYGCLSRLQQLRFPR